MYMYTEDYLIHYGIKGQKWGVRRYQNKDGTLTEKGKKRLAKDLSEEYKRTSEGRPYNLSDNYKQKIRDEAAKVITDDDKSRIVAAKKKWLDSLDKVEKAEKVLDKLAEKYGKEYYESEMKINAQYYNTPRMEAKLYEYAVYDYGYDKARESRPDLVKAAESGDDHWVEYQNECEKITDKILGKYGNTKLYESEYYSLSIRDTVGDIVGSMEYTNWK